MPPATGGDNVTLRDYIVALMAEHDRVNVLRLDMARQEISALKDTLAAYAKASELAVKVSQEAAQKVSDKANEFRDALDDANKNNVSRTEADARLLALAERIDGQGEHLAAVDLAIKDFIPRGEAEKDLSDLSDEIAGLRESRSAGTGRDVGAAALWGYIVGTIGLAGVIISIVLRFVK